MKKIYFFILTSILSNTFQAYSQDVRFGITAEGNSTGLFGPDKPSQYSKEYAYSVGFFIDTRFAEHMSTQVEANFTRYRFSFSEKIDNIEDGLLNVSEVNNYIRFPVMLKYKRGYEFIFYYFSLGGQASVLINNKREVTATSRDLIIDSKSYYDYKHNWYDYGFKGSIGFQFKPVTMGLSYYASMRNLYIKDDAREMRYDIASLNFSYQFNYRNSHPFDRKKGWKGLKYNIKHLF
ncbi:MAG: PorT family protein [Bacteroidales bacterium]|nr:PorT family protein [Bacteroidales bacterium]